MAIQTTLPSPFPVTIEIDATKPIGKMNPIYRFFGADEPNYAYMKDGQKLLSEIGKLGKPTAYFRTHNLLTSGDGTPALKWGSTNIYTEDAHGNPIYDWTIIDRIFDSYLRHGVRPYVQIGFMPEALSTKPVPYRHHWTPGAKYDEIYTGWAYPPKDYDKWAELIYQWVTHCVEKYGRSEVETWYWQTWNEANIGYWRGTPEEFLKLHDYTIHAVQRALPTARVGGCDVAGGGNTFLHNFLTHCVQGMNYVTGKKGTPTDFLSFHAKGAPRFVDEHVRMGISNQLQDIDRGFAMIATFPELKDKPIIIGESDPDGCAACQGPQLGYRNGTMYSSYTVASFARKYQLADRHGVNFEGALTWAFEFEDQPYFAGFRVLASNGIDLPVLNVFRMFGKMSGERLPVKSSADVGLDAILKEGVRNAADVSALASYDDNRLCVLVWHYHDDDVPGSDATIQLKIDGIPAKNPIRLTQYCIEEEHSNAFTLWKKMGSPAQPTAEQYKQLEQAGQLTRQDAPATISLTEGSIGIPLTLARHAVSLLILEWD